jgi:hypothetical protein
MLSAKAINASAISIVIIFVAFFGFSLGPAQAGHADL